MPVENSDPTESDGQPLEPRAPRLPGEFVNAELEAQTKRFLEEVKSRAKRRQNAIDERPPGPPPPEAQRSSRR